MVLTADEVARQLKLSKKTVYRMAQTGEIPSFAFGRSIRFSSDQILEWIEQCRRGHRGHPGDASSASLPEPQSGPVSDPQNGEASPPLPETPSPLPPRRPAGLTPESLARIIGKAKRSVYNNQRAQSRPGRKEKDHGSV